MSSQGNDVVFEEKGGKRKIEGKLVETRKEEHKRILEVISKKPKQADGQLMLLRGGKDAGARATLLSEIRTYEVSENDEYLEELLGVKTDGSKRKDSAFARMDYDLVHKEIMSIKGCRANIFMGTIGILGALGVAILGIVGTSKTASWHNWLPWAALVPIGLLTIAIFATIHKARKLNMRRGYMEALAEYLSEGSVPKRFCGWAKAKFIVDRCRIYSARTEPVDHRSRCPLNPKDESCAIVAKRSAEQIIRGIRFMPDLLHSFTSISTYVYGVAYLVAFGALLLAIMATIKGHIPNFSRTTYVVYVGVCGGVITAIFAMIIIVGRLLSARRRPEMKQEGSTGEKGEESVAEESTQATRIEIFLTKGFLKYLGYFACMVVTALFLILLYAQTKGQLALIVVVTYCLGGGIAAIAVFGAYSFYDKVTSLRKGRYSAERWRHVWKECFKRCSLMEPEID